MAGGEAPHAAGHTSSCKMEFPGHSRVNSEDYVLEACTVVWHYECEHVKTQQQNRFLNLANFNDGQPDINFTFSVESIQPAALSKIPEPVILMS